MNVQECPICMETIDGLNNQVVTECGHVFHCSCLMKNAAHNGFGCPYCRSVMAEVPHNDEDDEDDEDEEFDDEEEYEENENALTSFRMFHQRLNGEEVEEEDEADIWTVNDSDDDDDDDDNEHERRPDIEYISQKLVSQGVIFDDLIKSILYQEHSGIRNDTYDIYETKNTEIYTQFRNIIIEFGRQSANPEANLDLESTNIPVLSLIIPENNDTITMLTPQAPRTREITNQEVAEPKPRSNRRREYMI